ncbi:right-handed parallel beta-helix repeat-containing protein [Halobaculum halobium]|uniref:right-handed parallel beta-helix repeat-containing protein n=1 Tax=Halobaculum halobium TaxID=3032281 RepID=UPI00361D2B31
MLVEFPPGEYLVNEQYSGSVDNWGMRGLGDAPDDVRFVTDDNDGLRILNLYDSSDIVIENLSLDYGDDDGSMGLNFKVTDGLQVHGVHFLGFNPTDGNGAVDNLNPQVVDPDGTAVVDGVVRKGPTDITSHGHLGDDANEGFMWMGSRHEGTLYIRNCHIENTGTNGVYVRGCPGDIRVENCLFRNNNQTSFRIGGDGCYIKNTRFEIDTDNANPDNGGEYINPNAILFETGDRGESGGYLENCDFVYESAPSKTKAAIRVDGSGSDMEIRGCRFQMNVDDVQAILVDDPTEARLGDTAERPWEVHLDGVSVTGSGSLSNPAVEIHNRDGTTIRNSCLYMTGNTDGILLQDSDDSVIEDTNVNVTGQATIFDDSSVDTTNVTHTDTCPVPGDDSTFESSTTTSGSSLPNEITITGTGTKTNYEFATTGGLEEEREVEEWDEISGSSVNGWITDDGDVDVFGFDGGLGSVSFLEGKAEVSVNGHALDPATLSSDVDRPHTLQIVPTGTSTNYSLSVSGDIADHPALGTSLTKYDSLDGGTLEGWVTNDMDAVVFSGEITDFSFVEGGTTVFLDGEEVAPSELGSDGSTDDGSTDDGSTDDGSTDDGSTDDGSTDDGSTDDGSTDDGSTDDGSTDDGSTDDGSTDDGSTQLPNTLTIDGRDTSGLTGYEFTVTGDLERDAATDPVEGATRWDDLDDEVSGSSAAGVVDEGIDQYRFSGDVASMRVEGKASLSFEDVDG